MPCHRALYDAIGTRRYSGLSAYDFWWFRPTEEERAAGATWVRCDVGMRLDATYGGRSIPADVHLGPPPYPNRESNCLFGLYPDLVYVTCHDYHNYRAAKVIELRRLADSQEQYQKQGLRCREKLHPATTSTRGRRATSGGPGTTSASASSDRTVATRARGAPVDRLRR